MLSRAIIAIVLEYGGPRSHMAEAKMTRQFMGARYCIGLPGM